MRDQVDIRTMGARAQAEDRPARVRADAPQRRSGGVRALVSKLGALLAALALSFVLMGAGPVGFADDAFTVNPVQISVAYADEATDGVQNADATDDAAATDSEDGAEVIEDDDVPLAMAKSTSSTLETIIFVGVVVVVAAFVFFMYRMNRSISLMRNRFH